MSGIHVRDLNVRLETRAGMIPDVELLIHMSQM